MSETPVTNEIPFAPQYYSAVNAIIQPNKMVYVSRYLIQKWVPELGGDGLTILLFLRHRCFHDRRTGELRNVIRVGLAEIAEGCAISICTVRRQLQNNMALKAFVSSQEDYAVEKRRKGVLQIGSLYTVLMDDPIHPSDVSLLQEELQKREHEETEVKQDAKAVAIEMARTLKQKRSNAKSHREEQTPTRKEPTPSQIDRALERITPSQIDRALCISQRPINLRVQYLDYYRLPKDSKNTQQHSSERAKETNVVVSSEDETLIEQMVQIGVTRIIATKLMDQQSAKKISDQLQMLPYRNATNPAAVLVKAIREDWAPGPGYVQAQEEKYKRAKSQTLRAQRREETEQKSTQEAQQAEEIEKYWCRLGAEAQQTVLQSAEAFVREHHPALAKKLDQVSRGPIVEAMLEQHRRDILTAQITDKQKATPTNPAQIGTST